MKKKEQKTEADKVYEIFGNVFQEYLKDPKRAEKIEAYRRKYSMLTPEDYNITFTI